MELKQLLTDLLAIDSTSRLSNEPVVLYIEEYFNGSDVTCHRLQAHEEGKYNLLLTKGDPTEEGLTLCGHMDTVPASPERWTNSPWELTERDDKWYARGSCDMKGFDALAIWALVEAHYTKVTRPLQLALSFDEEIGCTGAPPMIVAMQGVIPVSYTLLTLPSTRDVVGNVMARS